MKVESFSGGGNVRQNHGTDSEACLNRLVFNSCVKKKAMKDL
jgi:hypothetical protein